MSYIHPNAHASYRQWWEAQIATYALNAAYSHLNLPSLGYVPRKPRKYYKWNSGRRYMRPWDVSTSGESSFRQDHRPRHKKDKSLNRQEKTHSFRKNDKVPCAWPIGGSARRGAQIEDNRKSRRLARSLIQQGKYDEVEMQQGPTDTWKWD